MYYGLVRFICDTKDRALVLQAGATSLTFPDGYRFVKSSGISSLTKGDVITYTYNGASQFNDGHDITILSDTHLGYDFGMTS